MPVTELSKAGTTQNSTIIVECCFFSTGLSSDCIAKSRTWGCEGQYFVFFCDIFSQLFVHGSLCMSVE